MINKNFRRTVLAVTLGSLMLGGCQITRTDTNNTASSVAGTVTSSGGAYDASVAAIQNTPSYEASSELPSADIPFDSFTLDNGLTVIVHEDRKAPVVAVNVWYAVGSKDEKVGRTGFAHLFEHLMFNGSENFDDEYFGPFERAGATDMNGTTNNDRTNYFQTVPTSALDMALWMESDRMGHLLGAVTQAKLDEQRGVVQNEKRQGESQPYGRMWSLVAQQTFPQGHPYSWSVIGSMEDLNAAELDDVHQWFKDYYGAANTVLVLAGDIDVATAKEKVSKYFGDIGAGKPLKKLDSWIAKRTGTKRQTMQDHVPANRVVKVWNTAEVGTPDADMLDLATDVLAGGKNSRLYQRLVYQEQLASSVVAFVYDRQAAGQVWVWADGKPGASMERIEAIIDEELARLLDDGPTAEELERIKFAKAASFVRSLERVGGFGGKSDQLASGQVYFDDPGFFRVQQQRLAEASPAKVRSAMRRWLSDGQFVLNIEPFPSYAKAEKGADRSKVPSVDQVPSVKLPALQNATLSNGLKVILAERHDIPTVKFDLLFDAGYAADPADRTGTASFAMAMLKEGTESMDALALSAQLERLGTKLSSSASVDTSAISLDTLSVNLAPSLALMSDVLLNPAFSDEEIERKRGLWIEKIRKEKSQPVSMALRTLPPLLYGKDHAYGKPLTGSGTTDAIKALKRGDLVSYHQTWLRPDNASLVVVGDTTLAQLLPLLEEQLVSWKAPAEVKPTKRLANAAAADKPRVFLIDKPDSPQSTILAGQLAPSGMDEAYLVNNVMNTIIGGSFTARLNMNLREDKHWAYGAYTIDMALKGQSALMAYAPVQTDKTTESIREVLKELTDYIGDKPATAEELSKVKANKTRKQAGAYETKQALSSAIGNMLTMERDEQSLTRYSERVNNISLDEVRQASREIITPDTLTWVIVGDLSKIEQGVRALNLGEVVILDEDGQPQS